MYCVRSLRSSELSNANNCFVMFNDAFKGMWNEHAFPRFVCQLKKNGVDVRKRLSSFT